MLASWGQRVAGSGGQPRTPGSAWSTRGTSPWAHLGPTLVRRRRVLPGVPGEVRHKDHMPVSSPFVIVLTDPERGSCPRRARSTRTPYRDRLRARIVLAAGGGRGERGDRPAGRGGRGHGPQVARRFAADRLAGLRDAPQPGRPGGCRTPSAPQVIALACELPAETGVPLSRWSCPELARELAARCQVRSRRPRCAGGWPRMRSSRGSTGPGSRSGTRTSRSRPPGCWTCTPGSGTGNRWGRTTS